MTKVRLEIDKVKIHRPKKNWKLYFVVVADYSWSVDDEMLK